MDDLIAFVTARLDEDERELVKDPPAGLGYANLAARMHREVEAGRRILERHRPDQYGCQYCERFPGPGPCPDLADLLVHWADHPDYRPEWKPQPLTAGW